jgi:hypothetical protein
MSKNCPDCETLEQILKDEIKKPTPPKSWLEIFPVKVKKVEWVEPEKG